jgi:hypothetical protein
MPRPSKRKEPAESLGGTCPYCKQYFLGVSQHLLQNGSCHWEQDAETAKALQHSKLESAVKENEEMQFTHSILPEKRQKLGNSNTAEGQGRLPVNRSSVGDDDSVAATSTNLDEVSSAEHQKNRAVEFPVTIDDLDNGSTCSGVNDGERLDKSSIDVSLEGQAEIKMEDLTDGVGEGRNYVTDKQGRSFPMGTTFPTSLDDSTMKMANMSDDDIALLDLYVILAEVGCHITYLTK